MVALSVSYIALHIEMPPSLYAQLSDLIATSLPTSVLAINRKIEQRCSLIPLYQRQVTCGGLEKIYANSEGMVKVSCGNALLYENEIKPDVKGML